MDIVDLRSDTVTLPTPAMREAMAHAELGDDVYREDPTVNRLEGIAADLVGKEAALFVPSGTMGNLAAILAHCQRGDEVILGHLSHTFLYEAGGISALGGVHSHQLYNQPDGSLLLEDIHNAIRPQDIHHPSSRLLCLENTHNRCGGAALSLEYTRQASELAHTHGLSVHLDGARIFNAAAALEVEARELVAPVDSVTFCLSKGLCAPVGSLLCGTGAFIESARRIRKQLGGGMRQAGVLAAAGIIGLKEIAPRLKEDHQRAQFLAQKLRLIPQLVLDEGTPHTNMVYVALRPDVPLDADRLAQELRQHGVMVGVVGARRFRLVTHYWIDDVALERAAQAFAEGMNNLLE
jgi:threonine aldolase